MNLEIKKIGPVGGQGGNEFTLIAEGIPTAVIIRSGSWIDAIQVVYTNLVGQEEKTLSAGGRGGQEQVFKLSSGEYITKVSGKHGRYIDSITLETNLKERKTFGGSGGDTAFSFTVPQDMMFAGFTGKSGSFVDALGICFIPNVNPFKL